MSARPQARVYRAAAASHTANATWQKVPFDTVTHDLGAPLKHFDDVNDQLVCRVSGLYLLVGNVRFGGSATGIHRLVRLVVDGTKLTDAGTVADLTGTGAAANRTGPAIDTRRLEVGDTVELQAFQDSGGSLGYNIGASADDIFLSMAWLSP